MESFIKSIPKAELHLHIEGSLEPELMMKLAKRNNIKIKFNSIEEIKNAYNFSNLQDFLDIYYEGAGVLIKEEDFYDLTWEYLLRCREDNVTHTEIFFDPQTHTDRGIEFDVVIKGIKRALDQAQSELGISSQIIMCFLRHLPEEEAFKTLEMARPYKDWIIGVGLDSSEVGHPPSKFKNVFSEALKQGYKTVAHAGEEGPTEYIWEAIELLKIDRVDHGVRSIEDEKLCAYLAQKNMPLTVCPFSNIKLRVFDKLEDHNIKRLLDKGLRVTVNSDDPAYFGGYMNDNFIGTAKALSLSNEDIATIAKNSFHSSFISEELKQKYISQIDGILNENK